jgi:hypothetical protein
MRYAAGGHGGVDGGLGGLGGGGFGGSMDILGYKAATGVGLNPAHSRPAANDEGLDIDRCGVFWSFPPPALSERPHGGLARRSWRAKGLSRRDIPARLEPVINTPERNS